jgi:hypothetical protein
VVSVKSKFQVWSTERRIEAAKRVTESVIDHVHTLLDIHENNAVIIYSDQLIKQIPRSFAANAFNVFVNSMHRYELIRLCALWDTPDNEADTECIATVVDLVDAPEVIEALADKAASYWAYRVDNDPIADSENPDSQDFLREALLRMNAQFAKEQAQKARTELGAAVADARAVLASEKLVSLRNLRHKHFAHTLRITREEKRGVVFQPARYGDELEILERTLPIIQKLYCWVNGTSIDLESSRSTDRKHAEALWHACKFDIKY